VGLLTPKSLHWVKNEAEVSWTITWLLVDSTTSQICASISKFEHDATWHVWRNGGGFGEYLTEAAARQRAEEIAK
jgi:hypothetical protein